LLSDPTDVERIEILKTQATASIYGLQGTNGVIAIYTKGESDIISKTPDFNRVKLPGYFWEREFYAPNYQGTLKNNPKPDRRVTISWQSSVQTDNTGKVKFSFFNSDVACNLDFVVEGLSKDGQPIYFYEQQ
jgi:TonB-dependent SusC/RagA subfamily outer membrane receptor